MSLDPGPELPIPDFYEPTHAERWEYAPGQESLFEPNAVSPAGAEGIAQFIPGTAKLRGLRASL